MSATSAQISLRKAKPAPAILWGGSISGALDITYAMVEGAISGRTTARTLKSVASGLLGRAAFQGGWEIAAFGLVLHFLIALGAATVYYAGSRRMAILVDRAWISGPLFGALVYLAMNRIVLPLSAVPEIGSHRGLRHLSARAAGDSCPGRGGRKDYDDVYVSVSFASGPRRRLPRRRGVRSALR